MVRSHDKKPEIILGQNETPPGYYREMTTTGSSELQVSRVADIQSSNPLRYFRLKIIKTLIFFFILQGILRQI